ncbi:transcriptional regulator with XRE-family HTH domain [Paenibacillus jamilae]|uniref:helix-turn-helix domain-containing protein n=1 Tax=Paenibacillus jamilae TaxID=114136 RepID=UPI0007ABE23E|nr:helix-turn-helix transcriptional regulator [Paenibacillus jamilae]KZE65077.1 hypothetical protein AV545_03915 [Paenibacillus jamilae]MDP9675282.1 transcriptional regulator with XRE-family HTH domain [Paenibacillus jamilae]
MIPKLIDIIKNYRESRGLSRREMANMTGLSERSIQNYETGASDLTLNSALIFGNLMGMNKYNVLISYHYHENNPVIGEDITGNLISEEQMFDEIKCNYKVSALSSLYHHNKDEEALIDLSVESGISKERLEEIGLSYFNECNIDLNEVVSICSALGKKFSELFALVAIDFVSDQKVVDVVYTLQKYIQRLLITKNNKPLISLDQGNIPITEDEEKFLKESLKVYRKLKLTSQ